jgi:hypothetical protein
MSEFDCSWKMESQEHVLTFLVLTVKMLMLVLWAMKLCGLVGMYRCVPPECHPTSLYAITTQQTNIDMCCVSLQLVYNGVKG